MSKRRALACGIAAIVCWSMTIGLVRLTLQAYGHILGAALLYTLGAIGLFIANRPDPIRDIPRRYLVTCGLLFVLYEICMAQAVGFARTQVQTLEVSMLNYLWPILMAVLCVALMRRHRPSTFALLVPGLVIAAVGIMLAVGGKEVLGGGVPFAGVVSNPLPYSLATAASILWAFYSMLTPRLGAGKNAVAYFFTTIAVCFWLAWAISGADAPADPVHGLLPLLGGTISLTAGYALWNVAIAHGDMTQLSTIGYASPVLSSVATSILLRTLPSPLFWVGVALLVVGSVWAYLAMHRGEQLNAADASVAAVRRHWHLDEGV
ncbi:MAG: aromatic amino acid DMT transporter YddG [Bifidobacterium sp.]|nr:aromatic amino acid DMT transporter YddG [Bifidobacterium sp.]